MPPSSEYEVSPRHVVLTLHLRFIEVARHRDPSMIVADDPQTIRVPKQNRKHNAHGEDGGQDSTTRMKCAKLSDFVKQLFRVFHSEISAPIFAVSRIARRMLSRVVESKICQCFNIYKIKGRVGCAAGGRYAPTSAHPPLSICIINTKRHCTESERESVCVHYALRNYCCDIH